MKQLILLVIRIMPLLFSCCIVLTAVTTLIPSTDIPNIFHFWDKVQHALAFTILSLTGSLAFPRKTKVVYIGLILYGASIEIMQSTLTTTRFGDVFDWFADSVGVVIGIIIYLVIRKSIQRLSTEL